MVWESTRDSHRAPAMNTYHLCLEIILTWSETRTSALREGLLSPILEELSVTGSKDPTIGAHFAEQWARMLFALKSTEPLETKVGAVERFFRQIEGRYLKRCRDEIQQLVGEDKSIKKERLSTLVAAFCSYILNAGYTPRHISRILYTHFFGKEVKDPPVRELQTFFAEFSGRENLFDVFMLVTDQLEVAAGGRDFENYNGKLPRAASRTEAFKLKADTKDRVAKFAAVAAFDEFGAVEQVEAKMALVRAVAYTARPDVILDWRDEAIVVSSDNASGVLITGRGEPLRQRYRDQADYDYRAIGDKKRAVFETELPPADANRLKNALLGYANAFHSESPATQLIALWSALEGLLPLSGGSSRIDTIVKYALACQRRLYLRNLFRWSFLDHHALDGVRFFALLDKESRFSERLAKFVSVLCFPSDPNLSHALGALASPSPLTTQRGFRLHKASKQVRELLNLVEAHDQRVDWHLRRIYRERNRIVHRADPSANVRTLILNLNEYIATIFGVLFTVDETRPYSLGLDGVFESVYLDEQRRTGQAEKLAKDALSADNASLVLGFQLV